MTSQILSTLYDFHYANRQYCSLGKKKYGTAPIQVKKYRTLPKLLALNSSFVVPIIKGTLGKSPSSIAIIGSLVKNFSLSSFAVSTTGAMRTNGSKLRQAYNEMINLFLQLYCNVSLRNLLKVVGKNWRFLLQKHLEGSLLCFPTYPMYS